MKGFDYTRAGMPVNRSIHDWRHLAEEATREGGFTREDRKLGETFIHDRKGLLLSEIYGINLKLKERRHG